MSHLNALLSDLRDRKLWPVAVALLAAVVAVPVLLSKSPASTPAHPATPGLPIASLHTGPTVAVETNATQASLSGHARDPFTQQSVASAASSTHALTTVVGSAAAAAATAGSTVGSELTGSAAGSGASSGGAGTATPAPVASSTPAPASITGSATPHPTTSGLTAREAYHVALSITNSSGGVDSIDPLERLSVLPSPSQPLLVELGVLQGGHSVLFAVQPGAVVSGPGTCTPGPVDCEILSLSQDETEAVSVQGTSGVTPAADFAVTDISVDHLGSAAAATRARDLADAAGAQLLAQSTSSALSLFEYDPGVGAIVDLRNLTVGGSN